MSRCSWFSAPRPQDILRLAFGELFRDCLEQARRAHRATLPKITGGMVGDAGRKLETSKIPMPECLGDMIKLFGLATDCAPKDGRNCAIGFDLGQILISRAKPPDIAAAFGTEHRVLPGSVAPRDDGRVRRLRGVAGRHAFLGGGDRAGMPREGDVIRYFNGGATQKEAFSFKRDLITADPRNYVDVLIRIVALVECFPMVEEDLDASARPKWEPRDPWLDLVRRPGT
jgi:hypothetical protein